MSLKRDNDTLKAAHLGMGEDAAKSKRLVERLRMELERAQRRAAGAAADGGSEAGSVAPSEAGTSSEAGTARGGTARSAVGAAGTPPPLPFDFEEELRLQATLPPPSHPPPSPSPFTLPPFPRSSSPFPPALNHLHPHHHHAPATLYRRLSTRRPRGGTRSSVSSSLSSPRWARQRGSRQPRRSWTLRPRRVRHRLPPRPLPRPTRAQQLTPARLLLR